MNKPNWIDAPSTAKYLAQTYNGIWVWLETSPYMMFDINQETVETKPRNT